jgi:hypothetical protein
VGKKDYFTIIIYHKSRGLLMRPERGIPQLIIHTRILGNMSVTVIRHMLHALSETMKPLRMSVDFNIMKLSGVAMAIQ